MEALDGTVAVVTGASRGLGLAIARELTSRGARLGICGRDGDALHRAQTDLAASGSEVVTEKCDIGVRSEAEAFVRAVREELGRVDVLINNAGVITVGPLETLTVDDFEEAMNTMFWGMVHTSLAVLPEMRQRGDGHIANVTSIGGKVSAPHLVPYSCAKFAAVAFSNGLQAEVREDGVHILTVVPGFMRTGSQENAVFAGESGAEVAWFSSLGNLPGMSMIAERAAKRIVDTALSRRRRQLILTPQAHLAARAAAALPGVTALVSDGVNRLLPSAGAPASRQPGHALRDRLPGFIAAIQDRAARTHNQRPAARPPNGT